MGIRTMPITKNAQKLEQLLGRHLARQRLALLYCSSVVKGWTERLELMAVRQRNPSCSDEGIAAPGGNCASTTRYWCTSPVAATLIAILGAT
eukprot:1698604-Prymnesium_polylepis.1